MSVLETGRPDDYLSRLAVSDVGRVYKRLVLDLLAPEAGHAILDLGCGPGLDLPALADAVGETGVVLGVDHDPGAVRAAGAAIATYPQVTTAQGDAQRLAIADDSLDRVHTDRVVQHVRSPERVVGEVQRVLRPGGGVAFAEPDWDTLVIDHPEHGLASAYRSFVVDHVVRNARIGRQLPAMCVGSGMRLVQVVPVTAVYLDVTSADQVLGLARVTERAVTAGYLTAAEAGRWLDHLRSASFFGAVTLFVTVAAAGRG